MRHKYPQTVSRVVWWDTALVRDNQCRTLGSLWRSGAFFGPTLRSEMLVTLVFFKGRDSMILIAKTGAETPHLLVSQIFITLPGLHTSRPLPAIQTETGLPKSSLRVPIRKGDSPEQWEAFQLEAQRLSGASVQIQ